MGLIPKDEGFFDLFDLNCTGLTRLANVLDGLFAEPTRREFFSTQFRLIERHADEILHRLRPGGSIRAETRGAMSILLTTGLGNPASTRHAIFFARS